MTAPHPSDRTPGPALEVSRDDVLAKRNALLAEAEDFQQFLERIQDSLRMKRCGDDPVSHDVARAVTYRTIESDDSYFNICAAWVANLHQAADALAETARRYGYTDEEIAASFGGSMSDA